MVGWYHLPKDACSVERKIQSFLSKTPDRIGPCYGFEGLRYADEQILER